MACAEWVPLAGGSSRVLLHRTYSLEKRNAEITRALIVIHGVGRDADNYFRHALAAAFLAGALENTVVVAPRFASHDGAACRDTCAAGEVNWQCQGRERWAAGGAASDNLLITAFDALDEILRKLARREAFPNLTAIVLAGHSAGGQFVSRYEMANRVHELLSVPVSYVVANLSSYAYLDALRPSSSALPASVSAAAPGYAPPPAGNLPPPFVPFPDAHNCTTYDNWPFGLQNRTGYAANLTENELRTQLAARPTTYLLGGLDILPLFGFDASCSAMSQGPTRLARGLAFGRFVNEKYGATHRTLVVPACGHSARCMFTDEKSLPILFPGNQSP